MIVRQALPAALSTAVVTFSVMLIQRAVNIHGTTVVAAYPSYKNHKNGCLNPYSMYKKELSVEEIVNSRMISDPITLLECCPTTDGAAAVIYCSEEFARRYITKLVEVRASKVMSACFEDPARDITNFVMPGKLAESCYEIAGIGPKDNP